MSIDRPIAITDQKPPIREKIRIFNFVETDCGPAFVWETTGRMLSPSVFSVKYTKGLTKNNSKPTHWLPLGK